MKIYTKTGDTGETSLYSGERVGKVDPLVEAYGTLDECNCQLGVALAALPAEPVRAALERLQSALFDLAADLATLPGGRAVRRTGADDISGIEAAMDAINVPPLRAFVLPGGTPAAAALHVARTVARRAEREALRATAVHEINPRALIYLNRLSDYLFLLARLENHLKNQPEPIWKAPGPDLPSG